MCNAVTFPFKVLSHSCLEQDLDEFPVGHHKLGDKVNVPVPVLTYPKKSRESITKLLRWLFALSENLPKIGQVQGSTLTAIVGVAIDMQDTFA